MVIFLEDILLKNEKDKDKVIFMELEKRIYFRFKIFKIKLNIINGLRKIVIINLEVGKD